MYPLIRIEEVRSEMYDVNHLSALPAIPILANRDMRRLWSISIILSRSLSSITLTHPFLISFPISNTITTLSFTINNALDYSVYISNIVRTANYFLYNIGKARSKLTFNLTKSLLHS